jgi:hypothetical protein
VFAVKIFAFSTSKKGNINTPVSVLGAFAGVSNQVTVAVRLIGVGRRRAVIASVSHAISVLVILIAICNLGAIILLVGDACEIILQWRSQKA